MVQVECSLRLAVAPAWLAEPALAEVPTIADTVPGYELSAWFGAGPTGAPPEIIQKLNQEINTGEDQGTV